MEDNKHYTEANNMTEQVEGNILIAEYDGWEMMGEPEFTAPYKCLQKWINGTRSTIPIINPDGIVYENCDNLIKYNKDWGLLIPVVKKVLSELYEMITYEGDGPSDEANLIAGKMQKMLLELKIEPLWQCTVEAIKLINKVKEENKDADNG